LITSEQEDAMYATIRRYSAKSAPTQQTVDEFKRRIEEKFVPTIQDIRGFHTYGVLKVGDKELLSISVFEDRQGAAESTRKAAEFVQKDPLGDQLSKPEVLEGELLVLREAGVGVR
jgi:molybdopterin synthase catalytic subunit